MGGWLEIERSNEYPVWIARKTTMIFEFRGRGGEGRLICLNVEGEVDVEKKRAFIHPPT